MIQLDYINYTDIILLMKMIVNIKKLTLSVYLRSKFL